MRLSKSRVLCYLQCPLKYKFQYIDKIPTEPVRAMERGKNLHTIFEKFFDEITTEKTVNEYKTLLIKISEDVCPNEDDRKDFYLHLLHFAKIQFERASTNKLVFQPTHREDHVEHEEKDFHIHGYVDCIEKTEDGEYIVGDYKSSNIKVIDDYILEMCIYAYMVKEALQLNVTKVRIYATGNTQILEKVLKPEDYSYMKEIVMEVSNKIDEGKFFRKTNQWCFNCQYFDSCINYNGE